MSFKKCKRCSENFLSKPKTSSEYCDTCIIINKKIDDGVMCPHCFVEPFELDNGETHCKDCGFFIPEAIKECTMCEKEIFELSDAWLHEDKIICTKCCEEKTKEPDPETLEQVLSRMVDVFAGIEKSMKIIADDIVSLKE